LTLGQGISSMQAKRKTSFLSYSRLSGAMSALGSPIFTAAI
jgi:hypothetical protein